MAYNIHQKLKDNIAAVRIALTHEAGTYVPAEKEAVLKRFSGFGGIKAILLPTDSIDEWKRLKVSRQDLALYPAIIEFHQLLQEHLNQEQYKQVIDSLKNSVLSSFYTPAFIPQTLYSVLQRQGIEPKRMYEPSAGAGVFISEAPNYFPGLEQITAVEKDILSGKILTALTGDSSVPVNVMINGFEESPVKDNGQYDLIVSNIPFGNFPVYDPEYSSTELSGKIHNYFFAKGLDKLGDGGLLAYITTDAFLNSPSNKGAREYLFANADFISLTVMPDNLMKDTGNTEAPNHLLIVQKNVNKGHISEEEQLLLESNEQENELGSYYLNNYILDNQAIIAGDSMKPGTNQYGQVTMNIWQRGDLSGISEKLAATIKDGLEKRFDKNKFERINKSSKKLTFLPPPEKKQQVSGVQLGMFDTAPVENINRAMDYLSSPDLTVIEKKTARIIGIAKTAERPDHESIVLVTAKARKNNNYYFKLYSNIKEIECSGKWVNAEAVQHELDGIKDIIAGYNSKFRYDGERTYSFAPGDTENSQQYFTDLKPHYREGTLVFHNGMPGTIHHLDIDNNRSEFQPFALNTRVESFYKDYIHIRDTYFELSAHEASSEITHNELREELNASYERFNYSQ